MVDAGPAVGGGRALVEHPLGRAVRGCAATRRTRRRRPSGRASPASSATRSSGRDRPAGRRVRALGRHDTGGPLGVLRAVADGSLRPICAAAHCRFSLVARAASIVAAAALHAASRVTRDRRAAAATTHDDTVYAFGTASLPRLDVGHDLAAPDRRHGDDRERPGLLARRRRRRRLLVQRAVLRLARRAGTLQHADRRHGRDAERHTATGSSTGDGGVFTFGDAKFYGIDRHCTSTRRSSRSSPGPGGKGYWLSRPTAACSRSARAVLRLDRRHAARTRRSSAWPSTPSGKGYWLVASDGGIFTFGDAQLLRLDRRACTLNAPIVGMARTGTGHGYWLAGADGGVFTFGDAQFQGSAHGHRCRRTAQVVQLTGMPDGNGYRMLALRDRAPTSRRIGPGSTARHVTDAAEPAAQPRLLAAGRQRRVRLAHPAGGVRVPEGERPARAPARRRRDPGQVPQRRPARAALARAAT